MVVVYLKNGEKAPMPDATHVRVDTGAAPGGAGEATLRCFWGDSEVGVFKWEEVAGYTVAALTSRDYSSSGASYDAWQARLGQ